MPIYEYKCKKCDENIEEIHRLGKAPKTITCPKCKSKCERFFSAPMIQFVGSGFYSTDNKGSQGKG